jgi:hypothetical protein
MIGRLLPILSLVVLLGAGLFAWQSGALSQALNPTVRVVHAEKAVFEGQAMTEALIALRDTPVSQAPTGAMTVARGASEADVVASLSGREAAAGIPAGAAITVDALRDRSSLVILRAAAPIGKGEQLSQDNVATFTLSGAPVVLKAVDPGKPGHKSFRAPFSLLFEGEAELDDHEAVTLDHPDLGPLKLSMQRVMITEEDDAKPTYEIVLN